MRSADDSWHRRGAIAIVSFTVLPLYLVLRWPFLHGAGLTDLTNADTSIIGLMGKKMFDGRGFDVFCWGASNMGPLTSMFTAAWAWPLSAIEVSRLWPLAVRLAAMTEVALGIAFLAWAVARIDRRAAAVLALVLAVGPPELFKISVIPLGHEMAFVLGAAMLAVVIQHLTAPAGRGWLSSSLGRLLFGVLAGVGWWMNRTVSLAIGAIVIIAVLRSELFARFRAGVRFTDRLRLRTPAGAVPGVVEAAAFVLHWCGLALIVLALAGGFVALPPIPFVFGRFFDGIILLAIAQLLVLAPRFRRQHLRVLRLLPPERGAIEWLAGFAVGYAPAFLAKTLNLYPHSYAMGFRFAGGDSMLAEAKLHGPYLLEEMFGLSTLPAGIVYGVALAALVAAAIVRHRRDVIRFLQLEPSPEWGARTLLAITVVLGLALAFLVHRGMRSRYLMPMYGPFFALVILEGLHWWDSRRRTARALVAVALGACLISTVTYAVMARQTVYPKPDPVVLLDRVQALDCRVNYLSGFNAYDYRLLTNDEIAFIPYVGHDHNPDDTAAMLKLPGRRCYITPEGAVLALQQDLGPRTKGRYIPSRADYLR